MAGEIYAILANLCYVGSNVVFRKTEHDSSPAFINMFRTFVGVISFIVIALVMGIFSKIFELSWDLWVWLILSFVFGQVIGDTAYFTAQRHLGTTQALGISVTFPVFTFLLRLFFLGKSFSYWVIFSFLFIALGAFLINRGTYEKNSKDQPKENENNNEILQTDANVAPAPITTHIVTEKTTFSQKTTFSIFLGFLASFGWAVGIVIIEYATVRINLQLELEGGSSVIGNVIRFPFALFLLMGVVYRTEGKIPLKKSPSSWLWLTVGAIIGTTLGAYFYTEAARVAGGNVMSLMATANPLFSLPISYFVNREKITWLGFAGVMSTMIGVVMILL